MDDTASNLVVFAHYQDRRRRSWTYHVEQAVQIRVDRRRLEIGPRQQVKGVDAHGGVLHAQCSSSRACSRTRARTSTNDYHRYPYPANGATPVARVPRPRVRPWYSPAVSHAPGGFLSTPAHPPARSEERRVRKGRRREAQKV